LNLDQPLEALMTSPIFGTLAAMAAMVAALILLQDPSTNQPVRVFTPEVAALQSSAR
jgi:hypothetical protein